MITEIKPYLCDRVPSDGDIQQAIKIATDNKCLVELNWVVLYSGRYRVTISESDTLESVRDNMPKYYGI